MWIIIKYFVFVWVCLGFFWIRISGYVHTILKHGEWRNKSYGFNMYTLSILKHFEFYQVKGETFGIIELRLD